MIKYFYPELYVEKVSSEKYVIQTTNGEFIKVTGEHKPCSTFYGYIVYEDVVNYIDLNENRLSRDTIVLYDKNNGFYKGVYIAKNVRLSLIEIKGYEPFILVKEGDSVAKGSPLAYVVTKKWEVRNIKSDIDGYVVLVIEFFWEKPERYILAVVDRNEFRQIIVREG